MNKETLFNGLDFYVPDSLIKDRIGAVISNQIIQHGGKKVFNYPPVGCIYILDDFGSEEFLKYRDEGKYIIGVPYFNESIRERTPLNIEGIKQHPIYSKCLENISISVTGFDDDTKKTLEFYLRAMSADFIQTITNKSAPSHIVAKMINLKAKHLMSKGTIVVRPDWVQECWEKTSFLNTKDFRFPVFSGMLISVTGYLEEDRSKTQQLVNDGGGQFSANLMNTCTLLICNGVQSKKTDYAVLWKIPILSLDWLIKSYDAGYPLEMQPYIINFDNQQQPLPLPPQQQQQNYPQNNLIISQKNKSISSLSSSTGGTSRSNTSNSLGLQSSSSSTSTNNIINNNLSSSNTVTAPPNSFKRKIFHSTPAPNTFTNTYNSSSSGTVPTNAQQSYANDVNNGVHQMVPFIPQVFKDKFFVITNFSDEQYEQMYKHLSCFTNVINIQEMPNTWSSSSMNVDYILAPHEKNNQFGAACRTPVVSIEWFDKCNSDNFLYGLDDCAIFRPVKKLGLFRGLSMTASGYTQTETSFIRMAVKAQGAKFMSEFKPTTITHLITTSTSSSKYTIAQKHRDKVHIVSDQWIIDSIREGARLPEENYTTGNRMLTNYSTTNTVQKPQHLQNVDSMDIVHDMQLPQHLPNNDDEDSIGKFQSLSRTPSQLFNPSGSSKFIQQNNNNNNTSLDMDQDIVMTERPAIQNITTNISTTVDHQHVEQTNKKQTDEKPQQVQSVKQIEKKEEFANNNNNRNLVHNNNNNINNNEILQPIQPILATQSNPLSKLIDTLNVLPKQENNNQNSSHNIFQGHFNKPLKSHLGDSGSNHKANLMIIQNDRDKILTLDSIVKSNAAANNVDSDEMSESFEIDDGVNVGSYDEDYSFTQDPNSQMVTYGEISELKKKKKLLETPYVQKTEQQQQQKILDLLNQTMPPPQPPPILNSTKIPQVQNIQPQSSILNQQNNSNGINQNNNHINLLSNSNSSYGHYSIANNQQGPPHFLLSGFAKEAGSIYYEIMALIQKLGGVVDENFVPSVTTHLISASPIKSEKMLCSCAAGIWILTSGYYDALRTKGTFVNEEPYEWDLSKITPDIISPTVQIWATVPFKCRSSVTTKKKRLFSECHVAICQFKNSQTWEFILKSGGAQVYECKSVADFTKDRHITHFFVGNIKTKTPDVIQMEKACLAVNPLCEVIDSNIITNLLINGKHLQVKKIKL
ncbi:BRCT domain-containing protein [Tieghemostelium lacteum]|uniref:BRCT domain-containing protein n=1 Tax=Tieghemostelium lacteum TaxID=361077 RepID=A0A151ZE15_TIELA|nr:BRCT domain-containing protein [Tieghemostelium lacteum]|eukprot:KYQ92198.1 BRCT domain-containing protein [Tieghemostelium lacteum]